MVSWKRVAPRGVWRTEVGFRKTKKTGHRKNKGVPGKHKLHNPFRDMEPYLSHHAPTHRPRVSMSFQSRPEIRVLVKLEDAVLRAQFDLV